MGFFSRDIRTMEDQFVQTLQDISTTPSKRFLQSLPIMIENSSNPKLKAAFEHHMAETQNQVRRVEQVFEMCNSKPKSVDCPAIDGKEAKEIAGDVEREDKEVLDAALIAAAQAIEHYEITRYGSLISWAGALGRDERAKCSRENLKEEKAADEKLTEIAESEVNAEASAV
jgi:ferritin-like metal-binding protein YciE